MADMRADEPSAKERVSLNRSFHLDPTLRARSSRNASIIGSSSLYNVLMTYDALVI